MLPGKEHAGVFAADPAWYFGDWATRASVEFWAAVWSRLHVMGPSAFGRIYIAVAAAALAIKPDKPLIAATAAAVAAFFAGWLVFPSQYKFHDYYQLPIAVILFMSFAVSMSRVASFAIGKTPARLRQAAAAAVLAAMALAAPAYAVLQNPIHERFRAGILVGVEYALRRSERFLLVGAAKYPSPTLGGQVSTKFDYMSLGKFEADCERYVKKHAAIVSWRLSECLYQNRRDADWFIVDDADWFFDGDGVIMFYMRSRR